MVAFTEADLAKATDSVIDAVEALVARHGWEACTVRQVAQAAGVSRGTVHDYFGGDALKRAVIELAYANLLVGVASIAEVDGTPSEVVRKIAFQMVEGEIDASLIVQVAALRAALTGPDGLWGHIVDVRVRAACEIAAQLERLNVGKNQRFRERTAREVVGWYEAACMQRVMNHAGIPDLLRLWIGFSGLTDSRHPALP